MQETVRRCDKPVKARGGETAPHGKVVETGEPTSFGFDGVTYTSDLCNEHKKELADCLAPFIAIGVASSPSGQAVRKSLKGKGGAFTTKDVRRWLADQGRDVAPSGRLPNELIEDYRRAHSNN